MTPNTGPAHRGRLLIAGVAVLATLSACQSEDDAPAPSPSSSEQQLATSVGAVDSYCQIQLLRAMIADGSIKRSQLPGFADMTEVDGTPLILDFKERIPGSAAAFVGRLLSSPGLEEVTIDPVEVDTCTDTTTDDDIEESQGGPGYLAGK